jgi:hypothetical protein
MTRDQDVISILKPKTAMMKAFVYKGPGKTALEDHPRPVIKSPTDAIIKVSKTTICGTDLHIIKGDVASCTPGRVLGMRGRAWCTRSALPSLRSKRAILF